MGSTFLLFYLRQVHVDDCYAPKYCVQIQPWTRLHREHNGHDMIFSSDEKVPRMHLSTNDVSINIFMARWYTTLNDAWIWNTPRRNGIKTLLAVCTFLQVAVCNLGWLVAHTNYLSARKEEAFVGVVGVVFCVVSACNCHHCRSGDTYWDIGCAQYLDVMKNDDIS